MNSDLWALLAAEKEYVVLVTCVVERLFDKATTDWIMDTVAKWPNRHIVSSPRMLQMFMWHLLSSVDIDTHVTMLNSAAEMNARLATLVAEKQKLAVRMIKKIQRGIKQLEKLNAKKRKRKLKRR